jgi:FeS assembly SUF system protein
VLNTSAKLEELRRARFSSGHRVASDAVSSSPGVGASSPLESRIIEMLRSIYDPEIPVNIYDLGLIYDINIADGGQVAITMTLTAPGCPVADAILREVKSKVQSVEGVVNAEVKLVFDPPWSKERMSETALLELGLL